MKSDMASLRAVSMLILIFHFLLLAVVDRAASESFGPHGRTIEAGFIANGSLGVSKAIKNDYNKCVDRGKCMISQLRTGEGVDPSPYTDYDQIKASGWEESETGNIPFPKLRSFVWNLGMAPDGFTTVSHVYMQMYLPDPTIASYTTFLNVTKGVIIVSNVESPAKPYVDPKAKNKPTPPLPLTHLSDYIFLVHKKQCGDNNDCLKRLTWVVHDHVVNADTINAVNTALTGAGSETEGQYPAWPGKTLYTATDTGAVALVGAPNGWGIAYQLAQHRAQYGPKMIDKVVVFMNGDTHLSLAYHIVPGT